MSCPFKTGSTWTFVLSSDLSASKVADHPVNPQAYVIVLRDGSVAKNPFVHIF